jgi:K+-transporting ATPase ATPase C chain
MFQQLLPAFRIMLAMTVLTGLIYPAVVTGICQAIFRDKANGSMVTARGANVGSSLIGQNFTKPEYFHPRPSAAGNDGYDGTASSGSNYGPTNKKLIDRVKASIEQVRKENPGYTGPIPADLVTTSGSGLDPHLSPESIDLQVERVAKARGIDGAQVRQIVAQHVEGRELGFLGEPRVNVLALNMALDSKSPGALLRTEPPH